MLRYVMSLCVRCRCDMWRTLWDDFLYEFRKSSRLHDKRNFSLLTQVIMKCSVVSCRYVLHCRIDMLWSLCYDMWRLSICVQQVQSSVCMKPSCVYLHIWSCLLCYVMSLCACCRFYMLRILCDDFLYEFRKSSRLHETQTSVYLHTLSC